MEEFKIIFECVVFDDRNDITIVQASKFFLNENDGIRAIAGEMSVGDILDDNNNVVMDLQTKRHFDFLNGNDSIWADLLNQNVDDLVRNMFRELIPLRNIPESPDSLIETGDLSFSWKENIQMIPIPGGVAGVPLADLIERFKLYQNGQNEMVVKSVLTLNTESTIWFRYTVMLVSTIWFVYTILSSLLKCLSSLHLLLDNH